MVGILAACSTIMPRGFAGVVDVCKDRSTNTNEDFDATTATAAATQPQSVSNRVR
jgi:hypothetical protein